MKVKLFLGIYLFIFSSLLSFPAEMTKPVSYDLNVNIEPESGEIYVSGSVLVSLKDKLQKEFGFDLHQTFILEKLLVDGKRAKFKVINNQSLPVKPASKRVFVELPENNSRKEIKMEMSYHGQLKKIPEFGTFENQLICLDDQVNSRLVELAAYSCWYPLFEFGLRFDINLVLSLPEGWQCVCPGRKIEERIKEKRSFTTWLSEKDTDIVIIASPALKGKTLKTSSTNIEIYFTQLPEEFINKEGKEIDGKQILWMNSREI